MKSSIMKIKTFKTNEEKLIYDFYYGNKQFITL